MLLREKHIAVFQANWNDKATNIAAIAAELSLGLDAMVFLDDNPVERGLVREMLPEVAVPELPEDPALYARTLARGRLLRGDRVLRRRPQARRLLSATTPSASRCKARSGDIDAYLASLEMTIVFPPFDATGRSRIAQLINKSNQFNLTTRRYDEPTIAAARGDPARLHAAGAADRHVRRQRHDRRRRSAARRGDSDAWEIDTWLMSCRVLGRRVEQMVLREI
jgi:FkbH-like protein